MNCSNTEGMLVEHLRAKGKDFISLAQLTKAPAALRKALGLSAKATAAQLEKSITPLLSERLIVLKGTRTHYLAFNQPAEVFVFTAIQEKPGRSPGQLAAALPLRKPDFLAALNRLLERGDIRCEISLQYAVKLHPAKKEPVDSPAASAAPARNDRAFFEQAYRELDKGQVYIRIHQLRDKLSWPRERFDRLLLELRDAGVIRLHAGDITTMTEEEVRQSFSDENNFFLATLTWEKS